MTEIQAPDGARYVVIVCVPEGEQTKVEAIWDEQQMEALTALELVSMGMEDVRQKAATLMHTSARMRLMQPLSAPEAVAVPDKASKAN